MFFFCFAFFLQYLRDLQESYSTGDFSRKASSKLRPEDDRKRLILINQQRQERSMARKEYERATSKQAKDSFTFPKYESTNSNNTTTRNNHWEAQLNNSSKLQCERRKRIAGACVYVSWFFMSVKTLRNFVLCTFCSSSFCFLITWSRYTIESCEVRRLQSMNTSIVAITIITSSTAAKQALNYWSN